MSQPGWIVKGYSYGFKKTSPGATDDGYPIGYIWIDATANIAYILSGIEEGQATWVVKLPDAITNNGTGGQINVIGESYTGDAMVAMIPGPMSAGVIVSNPGAGEHKITNLRVDHNHKLVATYDEE